MDRQAGGRDQDRVLASERSSASLDTPPRTETAFTGCRKKKQEKEKEKETNPEKRNIQKQAPKATEVWVGGETFNMMPSAAPQR